MNSEEVLVEIYKVFEQPMGLTKTEIDGGLLFPFTYLQRPGAGSRCLCTPSVSPDFEWNGRQVATLAKAGGFIYIAADEDLPGWEMSVSVT